MGFDQNRWRIKLRISWLRWYLLSFPCLTPLSWPQTSSMMTRRAATYRRIDDPWPWLLWCKNKPVPHTNTHTQMETNSCKQLPEGGSCTRQRLAGSRYMLKWILHSWSVTLQFYLNEMVLTMIINNLKHFHLFVVNVETFSSFYIPNFKQRAMMCARQGRKMSKWHHSSADSSPKPLAVKRQCSQLHANYRMAKRIWCMHWETTSKERLAPRLHPPHGWSINCFTEA